MNQKEIPSPARTHVLKQMGRCLHKPWAMWGRHSDGANNRQYRMALGAKGCPQSEDAPCPSYTARFPPHLKLTLSALWLDVWMCVCLSICITVHVKSNEPQMINLKEDAYHYWHIY